MQMNRRYEDLEQKLFSIAKKSEFLDLYTIGSSGRYDLYSLESIDQQNKLTACISAGVHGNETETVDGLVYFLEKNFRNSNLFNNFNFIILPAVNPRAYVSGRADNGIDVNSSFKKSGRRAIEAQQIMDYLNGRRVDIFLDLHISREDTSEFFLYERRKQWRLSLGKKITRAVSQEFQVDRSRYINYGYFDYHSSFGVVNANDINRDLTFEEYMFKNGAKYSITSECPNSITGKDVVRINYLIIESFLNGFLEILEKQRTRKPLLAA